ncbi:hypothetical protein SAMN06265360_10565 [Haloechinothrix alba]|uniref:Uncharacterized protein n=1 Tax=Haloechinothrix alba TaxID=664784 RepID=A0A238W3A9_9PSEU|nr:hypothetical protein [Haloechinothrix alba]SNR40891.1 hypothetical protein SAMN06265360_10565 [Haloechinothrix alba]
MTSVTHPAQPATKHAGSRVLHTGSPGMLLGGLLLLVGSLLPWVSTPVGSLAGTVGPGLWTLCAGTLVIAGALLPYQRVALLHAVLPALVVATIVVWQLGRMIHISATTGGWGQVLPGIGLVMVAGGAVIVLRAARRIHATS